MSQLNVTTLKHESAGVDNITLDSSGRVGVGVSDLSVSGANANFAVAGTVVNYDDNLTIAWGGGTGRPGIRGNKATQSMKFFTGNVECLGIDSAGRVTMPYQPCFSAWHSSAGSTSTAGTVLPFDATLVNVGNHYSTSTNRFTAPVAGIYQFSWTALHRDATVQCVSLYKNGTNIWSQGPLHVTNHNVAEATIGTTVFLNVAAGDYFDVRVFSISGGSVFYGYGHANFTGRLVG